MAFTRRKRAVKQTGQERYAEALKRWAAEEDADYGVSHAFNGQASKPLTEEQVDTLDALDELFNDVITRYLVKVSRPLSDFKLPDEQDIEDAAWLDRTWGSEQGREREMVNAYKFGCSTTEVARRHCTSRRAALTAWAKQYV